MGQFSPLVARLATSAVLMLVAGLAVALTAGHSLSSPATWVVAVAINGSLIALGVCAAVGFTQRDTQHETDVTRR